MRLLFLTPRPIWPLTSGNRLRDYHLSRQLAKRASVTIVEMYSGDQQPSKPPDDSGFEQIISLHRNGGYTPAKVIRGLTGPTPITVLKYFEPRLASQLTEILKRGEFDAVQIEGIHTSEYLPAIRVVCPSLTVVADWHNIESELMSRYSENARNWLKRAAAKRTAALLRRSELRLLETCQVHTVASEREGEKLLACFPSAQVHVVPNGVDADHYSAGETAKLKENAEASALNGSLLFVGSMDYHANIDAVLWFTREIWPQLASRHRELKFGVVGRDPTAEIRNLQSERILITGTVEDVRPYYAAAQAVIVPLRVGSGTRLKILEAMAAGVPIISTRLGAEGIDVSHNVHLLIADNGPELVSATEHLLASRETRNRLAQAARNRVIDRYDWSVMGQDLFSLYVSLLSKSR
jgi:glycosyltransferase involved in cell wall biosynthesis